MRNKLMMVLAALIVIFSFGAATPTQAAPNSATASDLRQVFDKLLGEHVILTAFATNAALNGRDAEFKDAAATLDQNTVDLGKAIGSVYGADAEKAFLNLWRAHIGMFVDYTVGSATKDQAKKTKALNDLNGYGNDFAAFLSGANPNLPKDTVKGNLDEHVKTLIAVIDDQAAGNQDKAYKDLRTAYWHMDMTAKALSGAIGKQFPDKFSGAAVSPEADLRAGLTMLLQEHVALTSFATNAALAGRDPEFKAAAAALDLNTIDLGKAIGSVYGADAEKAFLNLWRAHIGMFVDYTVGSATNDAAKKQKALSDLNGYGNDFAAFLSGANPNLPKDVVKGNLDEHIKTLVMVIDAQASKNQSAAFGHFRMAYAHMDSTANALSGAIVKQFPQKFMSAPQTVPTTGGETNDLLTGALAALVVALASFVFVTRTATTRAN